MDYNRFDNNLNNINNTMNDIDNICNIIANTFNELESVVSNLLKKTVFKLDFNEMLSAYSDAIDNVIITSSEQENLKYIGGKLTISHINNKVEFKTECYFMDINGKWVIKNSKNSIEDTRFKINSLNELIESKQLKFDIEEPKRR